MKRRSIFGLLFGGSALAQIPQGDNHGSPAWSKSRPANGICPVCGTATTPYKRQRGHVIAKCNPPVDDPYIICVKDGEPYGDRSIVVRCGICNVSFWQDAEDLITPTQTVETK